MNCRKILKLRKEVIRRIMLKWLIEDISLFNKKSLMLITTNFEKRNVFEEGNITVQKLLTLIWITRRMKLTTVLLFMISRWKKLVEQHSQQLFNRFLSLTSSSRWINAQFAANFYWLKSLSDRKRATTGRVIRVSTNSRSFVNIG